MRILTLACSLAALIVASPLSAQTLNVASAGDQNMVDYVKDYLAPMFEKAHPGVKVVSVGTGPGDSGSQKIYEKLDAQKGAAATDFDVVVIHQKAAGQMVKEGLLAKYTGNVDTAKLVSSETAKNSLGSDVSGYVMPMFQSSLEGPVGSLAWARENRKQVFGATPDAVRRAFTDFGAAVPEDFKQRTLGGRDVS